MFNNLTKIVFIVLGVFCCEIRGTSIELLPAKISVRGTLAVKSRYLMQNDGMIEISGAGTMLRNPNTVGIKIWHPKDGNKAKIEITAGAGEGNPTRLTQQFAQDFDNIACLIIPYLNLDLISIDDFPDKQGWKGIFGVTADDDDGIHMSSPDIAAYYNERRDQSLIFDLAAPVLNDQINPSPCSPAKNFVFKIIIATLDPTDQRLPAYDAVNSPCGVETVGTEKIYHVPFGIGCKSPTFSPGDLSVDIRGSGKVVLEGNNSYLTEGCVYIRKGVEAVIATTASMPQSNIIIEPNSTLSFSTNLSTETLFTMKSGTTLTVKDGATIKVPHNAILNLEGVNLDIATDTTISIHGKIRF